jgi:hypothetical protein
LRLLWRITKQPGQPPVSNETAQQEARIEAREERLANNEIHFRSVNERIQEMAVSFGGSDDYEFLCECAARGCLDRIQLTRRQYEHVRSEGTRFFVVPGHENIEVELVVERNPTFFVVEKDGHAGIDADHADPRAGDS